MRHNIIERQQFVDAVLAEFGPHPFTWGKHDCGKMLLWHLNNVGRPIVCDGTWVSQRGLVKWLKRNGGDGATCLDGWGLERIAASRALPADIVEIEGSSSPVGAFGIVLGNGRIMAYHEDASTLAVIQPAHLRAAWSI